MPLSRPFLAAKPCNLFLQTMLALAVSFTPVSFAHAKTYIVVLQNPLSADIVPDNRVQIVNPDGTYGIPAAGFGGYVDKSFITVPRVSEGQLMSEFGPALDAMHEILKNGLPPLSHSYVVLLEPEAGDPGSLKVGLKTRSVELDTPNQAMLTDGSSSQPFTASQGQVDADFGPLLKTLQETKEAGLPVRSYVVLLQNPDGTPSKILVTDAHTTTTLDKPEQALTMDPESAKLFQVDAEQVRADFGDAIDARPPLPAHVTLYFDSDSTNLTKESQNDLEKFLADLRDRPVPELSIDGYTDTVGSEKHNHKLSLSRADLVANQIRHVTNMAKQLEVQAHGEHDLLVTTPDNTPELKNRRVVVNVR